MATWARTSIDPDYTRPGQPVIVYPKFLEKLGVVLATENVGLDPADSRWPTYEQILELSPTWPVDSRPVMLPEDSSDLARWPVLSQQVKE
jgi:hypothetical protein